MWQNNFETHVKPRYYFYYYTTATVRQSLFCSHHDQTTGRQPRQLTFNGNCKGNLFL